MATDGGSIQTYKICSIDRMAIGLYALAISAIKPRANIYLVLTGGGKVNNAKIGLYPRGISDSKIDKTIVETRCPNPPFVGLTNTGDNIFPIDAGPEAQGIKGLIKNGNIGDDLLRKSLEYYQDMFNEMNGSSGIISEELINKVKNANSPLLMQWVVLLAVYDTFECFDTGTAINYLNNFRRAPGDKKPTEHDVEIYNVFRKVNNSLLKGQSLNNGRDMINYLMSKTFGDYGTIYAFLSKYVDNKIILKHMKNIRPFLIRDIAHDQHDTLNDVDLLGGARPKSTKKNIYQAARALIELPKSAIGKRAEIIRNQIKEQTRQKITKASKQITGLVKSTFTVTEPVDDTQMTSDEQSVISTASTAQTVVPEDDQFEAYMDEIYRQISFLDSLNEKEGFSDQYYDTLDMLKTNLLSSYLVVSGATRIIVQQLQQVYKSRGDYVELLKLIYAGYESSNAELCECKRPVPSISYGGASSVESEAMKAEGSGRKNTRRIRLSKRKSKKKTRKSKKKTHKD